MEIYLRQRDGVMKSLEVEIQIAYATDVAARGIDVDNITSRSKLPTS
jgi:superfamily II DNA/RNA helicase